jgi:phage terminase small subunit
MPAPRSVKFTFKGEDYAITEKQNVFAHVYIETGNATEAYRQAYDVDPNGRAEWYSVEACILLDDPQIAKRVEMLREAQSKLSLYNVLDALNEYEDARKEAKTNGMPAAMVSAINGKVKLFGLDQPVKHDITSDGKPIEATPTVIQFVSPEINDSSND